MNELGPPSLLARTSARALLAALLAIVCGCRAQRTLTITTDPPGANVRLNETVLGEAPYTHEFYHYGTWRVTATLAGYRTASHRIEVDGPWYTAFPFDLFSEVLFPIGWKDRHYVHIELVPTGSVLELPDLQSVLERAEALRRAGPEGPRNLPPIRTGTTTSIPAIPSEPGGSPGSP